MITALPPILTMLGGVVLGALGVLLLRPRREQPRYIHHITEMKVPTNLQIGALLQREASRARHR